MIGEREYAALRATEPERNKFTVISREAEETTNSVKDRGDLPGLGHREDGASSLSLGLALTLALRLKG